MSVSLFVPSCGTQNRIDWKLLVKERIAKIANLIHFFLDLMIFLGVKILLFIKKGSTMIIKRDTGNAILKIPHKGDTDYLDM